MSKRSVFSYSLITLIALALVGSHAFAPVSSAADGDLDASFGQGGIVSELFPYPVDGTAYTNAVQADGKIVLVGDIQTPFGDSAGFAVLRLNTDGSPDTSFGLNGTVITRFSNSDEAAGSVAIQPDGKIIAAGYYTPDTYPGYREYAIARYLSDGSLDPTFGNGGKVAGATEYGTLINALVLLQNGKILVAGTKDAGNNKMWLARFNADGSPDGTFGEGGSATIPCNQPIAGAECDGFALAVQSDGKALVGGTSRFVDSAGNRRVFAISRFTAGGDVDATFGTGGLTTTEFTYQASVYALGVTDTGKIVATGNACCAGGGLAIARYNSNGTPDTGFGAGGKVVVEGAVTGYTLLLRPGGKMLLAGSVATGTTDAEPGTSPARFDFGNRPEETSSKGQGAPEGTVTVYHFALMQFNADGSFDNDFGSGGKVYTDFGGARDRGHSVAQAPDGRLVAAGRYTANEGGRPVERFAVARYSANGTPDTGFGDQGKKLVSPLTSRSQFSNVEVQSDNKVVALGEMETVYYYGSFSVLSTNYVLARYNENGTPDTSFGTGGKTIVSTAGTWTVMALQNNGKIVLGGNLNNRFALTQYNQDGSLDTNFGTRGLVTTWFTFPYSHLNAIEVLADGKIVALGGTNDLNQFDVALARYNPDGSLDTTFGDGGKVVERIGKYGPTSALAVQADGKIVIAGGGEVPSDGDGTTPIRITVVRFTAGGSLDASFGNGGVAQFTEIRAYGVAQSLAIQPDQKIVVGGNVQQQSGTSGIVIRWNTNGALDGTFGSGGHVLIDISPYYEAAGRIAAQSDGKLVVAEQAERSIPALLRYNPDGSLDATFGNGGIVQVPTLTYADMDLQQDGKIVTAGTYTGGKRPAFALARFGGDQPAAEVQFQDVPSDSTFYSYISCMANLNVISGYPCGGPDEPCGTSGNPYFRPGNSMTRGQVSKIVANAAGFNDTPTGQTFQDVPPGSPFYDYIERMAARKIISGYPCGGPGEGCVAPGNRPYFRPNASVSRGQLTKIVSNAGGYSDMPSEQTFEDVPTSNAFYLFVERLVSRGVMSGYACGGPGEPCQAPGNRGYFRPGMNVTRGQASKIVGNTFFPNCQSAASPN